MKNHQGEKKNTGMGCSPQPTFYICHYSSLSRKRAIEKEEREKEKRKKKKRRKPFWIFRYIPEEASLVSPLASAEALGEPVNQILTPFLIFIG